MAKRRKNSSNPDKSNKSQANLEIRPESHEGKQEDDVLLEELLTQGREISSKEFQEVILGKIHKGPLPPSEELKKYDEIVPGAAKTIIDMAVKEQSHRINLVEYGATNEIKQANLGKWLAFIVSTFAIGGSIFLAMEGHSVIAGLLVAPAVFSLAGRLIEAREKNK